MALYTVVFEYREGTYIKQVKASGVTEAFRAWAKNINPNEIQYFGEKSKMKMIEDTHDQDYGPTALTGVKNVWSASSSFSGLINIIKTHH